jgi:LasA protease
MGIELKLGMVEDQKIKLNGKFLVCIPLVLSWLITSIACTRSVIQPGELTQTAAVLSLAERVALESRSIPTASETGIQTNTPAISPSLTVTFTKPAPTVISTRDITPKPPVLYYTQSGDTLPNLAARFGVDQKEIILPDGHANGPELLAPNQLLVIPDVLNDVGSADAILPDSEVVFSPSAVNFDVDAFTRQAGGYLTNYKEWLSTGWASGAELVYRVALENSINPRLLLAILEYQGHWVYGQPENLAETDYPIGYVDFHHKGLYRQLSWAVQQLSIGYYGWRAGLITELDFSSSMKGSDLRIAPTLNAGSVAMQNLFSKLYNERKWGGVLYSPDGLMPLYEQMFDNPWLRAQSVEPLYPPTLVQPELQLPFLVGKTWSLTGGPHSAWGPDGALAAIDFAPASMDHGCAESQQWVSAAAAGTVVRSENGIVVIDLDGDGYEQTGWALFYLHIATKDRIGVGSIVDVDDRIGHPSCEGGVSTGTHFHFARKYNGEWLLADGPVPFVLSGYRAYAGDEPYLGRLVNGSHEVVASMYGDFYSNITRSQSELTN